MADRKGKGIVQYWMMDDPARESVGSTSTKAAGTSGGEDGGSPTSTSGSEEGTPGRVNRLQYERRNAWLAALVADQPHARPVGRQPAPRHGGLAGAYFGEDDRCSTSRNALETLRIRDNPGQNAPRSAPVAGEPRLRQQRGVVLGGSNPRHGHPGQAQDSGTRPPPPKVCPRCRNSVFLSDVCVYCPGDPSMAYPAFTANGSLGAGWEPPLGNPPALKRSRHGLEGPPQEHRPHDPGNTLELWLEVRRMVDQVAARSRSVGERGGAAGAGGPPAALLGLPGLPRPPPQVHPHDQRAPRPQQHPQLAPPVGGSVQQLQLQIRHMEELLAAAGIRPVGECGGAAGAGGQLGLPGGLQWPPPQVHPHDQRVPRPQQHPHLAPPVGASEQEQQLRLQLRIMAEELAASGFRPGPVGGHGGATGGRPAAQLGLPGFQWPPQAQPVPRAGNAAQVGFPALQWPPQAQPVPHAGNAQLGFPGLQRPPQAASVRFHYLQPVVFGPVPDHELEHPVLPADLPGPGPINEDEFDDCSVCGEHPAPVLSQPWRHGCVCLNCLSDKFECEVCTYDQ